jgi:hypothetical protein
MVHPEKLKDGIQSALNSSEKRVAHTQFLLNLKKEGKTIPKQCLKVIINSK